MEKIFQEQNKLFYIGSSLTILSAILIGILNVGILYLFGVPILFYIFGLYLIWIAKKSVRAKSIVTLISLVVIPVTFFTFFVLNRAEPEDFLIPENFRGEFVIFYDEPCGQKNVFENGKRIYRIPDNGVLIINAGKNKGYLNQKFYLLNENGDEAEIPFFHWQNFESEKENWKKIHSEDSENFTKETVGAFWSYGSQTYEISNKSFAFVISDYIYYNEGTEKQRRLEQQQFTQKAENSLKQCREKLSNNR